MNRKYPCKGPEKPPDKPRDKVHPKTRRKESEPPPPPVSQEILDQISRLKDEIKELKSQKQPQNILQVVYVGNNENYLDVLSTRMGFDNAIGFIKDCALANVSGDCRLIERVYSDNGRIRFAEKEPQTDQLARKLAGNLQNSYLRGVNYLINSSLDSNYNPVKLLEDHDLQSWNRHIYELSDHKYQRKILEHLDQKDI
jgi:hypothetical protein